MFTLWVLCHAALVLCGLLIPVDNPDMGLYAAAGCSLGPTILVFALLFLTASLVGALSRQARARMGTLASPLLITTVYTVGLGSLAASALFAYRIGFSTPARLSFAAFAAATCGMFSARKQGAV